LKGHTSFSTKLGHGILSKKNPFQKSNLGLQKKWNCEKNRRKIPLFRAPVSYERRRRMR
jgi:hypothetical protein